MNCSEVEKCLAELMNDELAVSLAESVRNHVKQCPGCEETLTGLRAIGALLRNSLPVASPSPEAAAAILGAFHRVHQSDRTLVRSSFWGIFSPVRVPRLAFAVTALVVLAMVVFAFRIGRLSATDASAGIPMADLEVYSTTDKPPQTRIVQIPVTKVKTRPICVREPTQKNAVMRPQHEARSAGSTLISSIAGHGYVTQTSLRHFQPLSTIKFRMVKGNKSDAK
jgi:hypothetical protein